MATVYVVTAGTGDTYRIERIYLDSDEAYRFEEEYNGTAPVEPVQVEELFWDTITQVRANLAGVSRK